MRGEVGGNARRRRRRRRGRRDTGPRGPGWLAFEAGQKNGSRTRRRDIHIYICIHINVERERERGGDRDPLEEDRARTRARGTGVEAAQEVNVQGGNLFGVHGPLSTSKLAGSHPAQSASKARAKDPCAARRRRGDPTRSSS